VGIDVGFENPIFAALEVDVEEVENDPETNEPLYEKVNTKIASIYRSFYTLT